MTLLERGMSEGRKRFTLECDYDWMRRVGTAGRVCEQPGRNRVEHTNKVHRFADFGMVLVMGRQRQVGEGAQEYNESDFRQCAHRASFYRDRRAKERQYVSRRSAQSEGPSITGRASLLEETTRLVSRTKSFRGQREFEPGNVVAATEEGIETIPLSLFEQGQSFPEMA